MLSDFEDLFLAKHHMPTNSYLKPPTYPPSSIYSKDGVTFIDLAVAGFRQEDLDINLEANVLTISGKKENWNTNTKDVEYQHRGIAARPFTVRFNVNPRLEVKEASLELGILSIKLVDPGYVSKKIPINSKSELLTE